MSFEISGNGKEIATALDALSRTAGTRTSLPILSCVALKIVDGEMIATASNLNATQSIKLPAVIKKGDDGEGCCPAFSPLVAMLGKFGSAELTIKHSDSLRITSGKQVATLQTLPLGEFPFEEIEVAEVGTVNGSELAAAIRSVAFAQSTNDARYVLNGVHFNDGEEIEAADGSILAVAKKPEGSGNLTGIIPTAAIQTILGILDRNESATLLQSESHVCIRSASEHFTARKIEGTFPSLRTVLPSCQSAPVYSFDKGAMKSALSLAGVYLAKEVSHIVRLHAKDGSIQINATGSSIGNFSDEIEMEDADQPEMTLAVNAMYLSNLISIGDSDTCQFAVQPNDDGSVSSPILFRQPETGWMGCVMPCRY